MQLAEHGHERVICRLHREIVELALADVCTRTPPSDLGPGGEQQQLMQALDGAVALRACAGELSQPAQ